MALMGSEVTGVTGRLALMGSQVVGATCRLPPGVRGGGRPAQVSFQRGLARGAQPAISPWAA